MTYGNTSTYYDTEPKPLTLETLKEMRVLIEDQPPAPLIFYSWVVPHDQAYYGDLIDKIAAQQYPGFDPSRQKAIMLSPQWQGEIEDYLNSTTGSTG